jgi:hypothetical protein
MSVAETTAQAPARTRRVFDGDSVAHLEVAGWKAYYDRKWFLFVKCMLAMIHRQLRLSWPRTVQAAYYITKASVAWAPVDHDEAVVKRNIRKFYRLGRRYGKDVRFDPDKVAALEFKYWDDHRRLSGRPDDEKGPLIQTLAELHSATFLLPMDQVWQSAIDRAHSTDTVDLITGKRSTDIEGDWARSEVYLKKAYGSIAELLNN